MTRLVFIRRLIRQIYGENPSQDASITDNLVNVYINEAIASAARQAARENLQIDGVAYVSSSFYTTVKGLVVTPDGTLASIFKCQLPSIPLGLGRNDGIASVKLMNDKRVSVPLVMVETGTFDYTDRMPKPKATLCCSEGSTILFKSPTLNINGYTAVVRMISSGDFNNLESELNIPDEYITQVHVYVRDALFAQRKSPKDVNIDGLDN